MKKAIGLGLLVLLVVTMVGWADTSWWVDVTTTGETHIYELVGSGHTKIVEQIDNWGTLDLHKHVTTSPATEGMNVSEFKYVHGTGTTSFRQCAVIGGLNWQYNGGWSIPDPRDVATAYIDEYIENEGEIEIFKDVNSSGDWNLEEWKDVYGSGETTIEKSVGWWSNCERGLPEDRTEMEINLWFESETTCFDDYMWNKDGLDPQSGVPFYRCGGWCPDYEEPINHYDSAIWTNEDFEYYQYVGVNND